MKRFEIVGGSDDMWRWVIEGSRIRKARRAACSAIAPMVERSRRRLDGIPDSVWSNPYIIGFMVMLITIVARVEIGKIEGQPLCHVQAKAWEDITGQRSDVIGEEILLLSEAGDRDFEAGCRNAMTLGSMLVGHSVLYANRGSNWLNRHLDLRDTDAHGIPADRDDVSAVWEKFFDFHAHVHARVDVG